MTTQRPYKQIKGGVKQYQPREVARMIDDILLMYEADIYRLGLKSRNLNTDKHETLNEKEHMILEKISKQLIMISKEQRVMRKDLDFNSMTDDELEEYAEEAVKNIKSRKKEKKEAKPVLPLNSPTQEDQNE